MASALCRGVTGHVAGRPSHERLWHDSGGRFIAAGPVIDGRGWGSSSCALPCLEEHLNEEGRCGLGAGGRGMRGLHGFVGLNVKRRLTFWNLSNGVRIFRSLSLALSLSLTLSLSFFFFLSLHHPERPVAHAQPPCALMEKASTVNLMFSYSVIKGLQAPQCSHGVYPSHTAAFLHCSNPAP